MTTAVLADLSSGELIWLGDMARTRKSLALAEAVSLLGVGVTPGALNLLGAVLRSRGAIDASIQAFAESIEICESARINPYAYVGLAATFRRWGRYDEAWDLLKRPLKQDPDDEKALNVRAALIRDLGIHAAA